MTKNARKRKLSKKIMACSFFGIAVVICCWWAYSLYAGISDCRPSGTKLGLLIAPICATLGSKATAVIPLLIAAISAYMFVSSVREKI